VFAYEGWKETYFSALSLSHFPTSSMPEKYVNLNWNVCQSKSVWHKQNWIFCQHQDIEPNGQLLTYLYIQHYISNVIMFYILLPLLCPKASTSSFICKIIGHLFIARGCDTRIIWNERVCENCVHFSSNCLWSNVKTAHNVTNLCSKWDNTGVDCSLWDNAVMPKLYSLQLKLVHSKRHLFTDCQIFSIDVLLCSPFWALVWASYCLFDSSFLMKIRIL
jgi:hypothetical protein